MKSPMRSNALKEKGFISIFTAMIIMGILTLLVIGFSFATRQAQRRTLDDLLSLQAFYAAESGVNEAIAALKITPNESKDTCDGSGSFNPGSFSYNVDNSIGLSYTCLLVDSTVDDYVKDEIPVVSTYNSNPIVIPVNTPANITNIDFAWGSTDSSATARNNVFSSNSPQLPPASVWGSNIGMLRIDLVPATNLARANLTEGSYTFFLYPTSNTGAAYPPNNNVAVLNGPYQRGGTLVTRCTSALPYPCRGTVNLLGAPAGSSYYMRIQAYYNSVKFRMSPRMELRGLQAVVDSTGKANDIFRRIQVRVPLYDIPGHEPFGLSVADSICKRLVAAPPVGGVGGTAILAPAFMPAGSCNID
ncbi:pilus assembly PilX N-terminal domain-containing protein [Candidatus Saccharibacteria bacterium]|nr:pilus assembly PilX N-terminal domain-containing protein [Candidatus Saccharibacteria bacterium]